MPLTRSKKEMDVALRASSIASKRTEESNTHRSERKTSIEASVLNFRPANMESSGYTATEYAGTTKMVRSEHSGRLTELTTADKNSTEQRNQNSSTMAEPGGSVPASVKSVQSTRSRAARLQDLKEREKLALLELQRIEAAANLARIRLEKIRVKDETDDLDKEHEERTAHVQNWIQTSSLGDVKATISEDLQENLDEEQEAGTLNVQNCIQTSPVAERREQHLQREGMMDKVDDLDKEHVDRTVRVQSCVQTSHLEVEKHDLPEQENLDQELEDGISQVQNWIEMSPSDETEDDITEQREQDYQGSYVMIETKECSVQIQAFSDAMDKTTVGQTLNQQADEVLALNKKSSSKRMDATIFYDNIPNREIVKKLPTYLKFRWYDYADENEDQEPADLVLMAQFLNKIADTCGAYASSVKKKQLLNREATHTAAKEDEGGGELRRLSSSGIGASPCQKIGAAHKGEDVGD